MRLFGIIMVSLICIPALSMATPDGATVGLYNVSFDLGLSKTAYNVTVNDSADKDYFGGIYSLGINHKQNNLKISRILINDDGSMPSATVLSVLEKQNINTTEREIDGINGTLTTGDLSILGLKIPYYEASYYPFEDTGVLIISILPDKGNLKLLDNLHIEKINASL